MREVEWHELNEEEGMSEMGVICFELHEDNFFFPDELVRRNSINGGLFELE